MSQVNNKTQINFNVNAEVEFETRNGRVATEWISSREDDVLSELIQGGLDNLGDKVTADDYKSANVSALVENADARDRLIAFFEANKQIIGFHGNIVVKERAWQANSGEPVNGFSVTLWRDALKSRGLSLYI